MKDETKGKIRAMAEFVLGNPDPTTKDPERIKKDSDIKSQMQKRMGWRYPGQHLLNARVALPVGILGFVVFIAIIGVLVWMN